jgi:hypothetical protein
MTYARRYSIASMIGLMVEDDDAETACGRNRQPRQSAKRNEAADVVPAKDMAPPVTRDHDPGEPGNPVNFPHIDGIAYQRVQANDGQECVIATGDTMPQKEVLKSLGFKWNISRKIWWRYAKAV